jgi:hypothetical protein
MSSFTVGLLNKLKEFLHEIATSKQDSSVLHKNGFNLLNELSDQLEGSFDKAILRDEYLLVLEDLLIGKKIFLTKSFQILICKIYSSIIINAGGYQIRNLITSLINLCNNKLATWQGKEITIEILGIVIHNRLNDCASQLTDIIQLLIKFSKISNGNNGEIPVKLAVIACFKEIISYENGKLTDVFMEIMKTTQSRFINDRTSVDIRLAAFSLLYAIVQNSNKLTTVSADLLLPGLLKGLEGTGGSNDGNESSDVTELIAQTVALIYEIQIKTYTEKQELTKIGAARGGSDPNAASKAPATPSSSSIVPSRLSLAKLTSLRKVVVEETYDFRSIVENTVLKGILKPVTTSQQNVVRTGYLFILGYLIKSFISVLSSDDLEWLTLTVLSIVQDNSIASLTYEEQTAFRCRLSFVFRTFFLSSLNELQLITVCSTMIINCSNIDTSNKSDLELLVFLNEIAHILTMLGTVSSSLIDEVITATTLQLRHSNFSIRYLSANIIALLSLINPSLANDLLRTSLNNLQSQVKQLLNSASSSTGNESMEYEGAAGGDLTPPAPQPGRRKSIKESERLQRLYYFHGHSLVISMILKQFKNIPDGLPMTLINEIFLIGLEMITQDLLAIPISSRHVICSLIRSGGMIISSLLSIGYHVNRSFIHDTLIACQKLISLSDLEGGGGVAGSSHSSGGIPSLSSLTLSGGSSHHSAGGGGGNSTHDPNAAVASFHAGNGGGDELIFEIMTLESACICLSSLLIFSSQALIYEKDCLFLLIESLEFLFRNLKLKYYNSFKGHYRYRILHVTLLEIFSLLPSGSYPNTSQAMYIESLRVFRDCITNGYETTADFLTSIHLGGGNSGIAYDSVKLASFPMLYPSSLGNDFIDESNDQKIMMKLEAFVNILQKKEYEAYTFICWKEDAPFPFLSSSSSSGVSGSVSTSASSSFYDPYFSEYYHPQSSRLTNQSSVIDSRMMNACINLLAITFPHQLSEYQDKAIQLFNQALQQVGYGSSGTTAGGTGGKGGSSLALSLMSGMTGNTSGNTGNKGGSTSSTSSLLSSFTTSDEEKRKKEKKTFIIIRNIVCIYSTIIKWFPIHSGKYYELDYQWRSSLIDNLYSLLTYSSSFFDGTAIRKTVAESLSLFAIKWKGSNIISTICNRIRMSIMSIFEKKASSSSSTVMDSNNVMIEFSGYVIVLTQLWLHSINVEDVQSLALTVSVSLYSCFFLCNPPFRLFYTCFSSLASVLLRRLCLIV